ncbi:BgTH12-05489 [Blumeria graminis f. sp. triticale]|uniref:BgTH12-05489 n=1 Tax=Blumeria graminis f. sp. triticale TaxID=1689686 RepID=A0A9W4DL27_BLUGR|nr:BgTH12-05489 [Blumeria graminis f. sp. triticale]
MRTFSLLSLAAILNYLTLPSAVGYSSATLANASSYKCQDRVIGPITLNDQIEKLYARSQSKLSGGFTADQIFARDSFHVVLLRGGVYIPIKFDLAINHLKQIIYLQSIVMEQKYTCSPTTEPPQLNMILD